MNYRLISLCLFSVSILMTACQTTPTSDGTKATSTLVGSEDAWQRTELYFAVGLIPRDGSADENTLSEGTARWEAFLDDVVTPLFPDGLTVFDAVGQWMSDRFDKPPHLATKVLVILHPATDEANARIERIREEFLDLTGQQSVLRVTMPVEVSF